MHTCALLLLQRRLKKEKRNWLYKLQLCVHNIVVVFVFFVDAWGCWKSCNGLWVVCMSECGISSLSCERINLARNVNTVTDITNAYLRLGCMHAFPVTV